VCVCVCVCVCVRAYDIGTSTIKRPRPELGSCTTENKRHLRGSLDLQVSLVLSSFFCMFSAVLRNFVDPGRRAFSGVGLRSFALRDCGFNSCGMVVSCECCVLSGRSLCVGLIACPGESCGM
jgi:hypothetical protein